jgi:hypothetical protein
MIELPVLLRKNRNLLSGVLSYVVETLDYTLKKNTPEIWEGTEHVVIKGNHLTLIRAVGGVHDFGNFEHVQLHNPLSK